MSTERPKAKSARLSFSQEHTSRSHPEPHTDSMRQLSNQAKPEKTGHNPSGERKVPLRKG